MNNIGVIYIVYSNKHKAVLSKDYFFKEAEYSVNTLKKLHPNLHTTLYTDIDPQIEYFDDIKIIKRGSNARLKPKYLYESPYDYTLYIDSDTAVVGPIEKHFELLDRFDLAAVHDACRAVPERCKIWKEYNDIPSSFGEYCSGLIFFKKSTVVEHFFKLWQNKYDYWINNSQYKNDQPSFRVALWQSKELNIHTLPIEFCVRTQEKIDAIRNKYPVKPIVKHWHEMFNTKLNRKPHKIHL